MYLSSVFIHKITSLHVPRSLHRTIGDGAFPVAAAKVWNALPPAITSLPSLGAFKRALKTNCSADHRTTQTIGHSNIDITAVVTHSGPEVLFKTCVAMQFVDDDDDDDRI